MNKTVIFLIIVFLIVISIISYLLLSPCPDGKEKKGFKCVDKAAASTTSSQRSNLFGNAVGCTSSAPYRDGNICVAVCPPGKVINDLSQCIIPRSIIPPLTPQQRAAGITKATVTNVSQCPPDRFKEYGTCVPSCSLGMIRDISDCVATCPTASPAARPILDISFGLPVCVASCPPGKFRDLSNGVTPVCRTSCPSVRPRIDLPGDISRCQPCSTRTPSQVNNNGTCMTACPAGTYRNDISMCVPINPLISMVRDYSHGGASGTIRDRLIDGNVDSGWIQNPSSNPFTVAWANFKNFNGKNIYGFTLKFDKGTTGTINIKLYKNITTTGWGSATIDGKTDTTSLTLANQIYSEDFQGEASPKNIITIRRNINPPTPINNLLLIMSRLTPIYEFEVTVR
jgi:hypothetical protein